MPARVRFDLSTVPVCTCEEEGRTVHSHFTPWEVMHLTMTPEFVEFCRDRDLSVLDETARPLFRASLKEAQA